MVTILTILAVLAGMAVPVFHQAVSTVRLDTGADAVLTALNFSRINALTTRHRMRVVFDADNETLTVQAEVFTKLDKLQDTSRSTLAGKDVESKTEWETVPHPVDDLGRPAGSRRGYTINVKTQSISAGTDLFSAQFGATGTVTYSTSGTPDNGGTVVTKLAGQQRTITVNASSGVATKS